MQVANTAHTQVTYDEAIKSFTENTAPTTVWDAFNDLHHFYSDIHFTWTSSSGWSMHLRTTNGKEMVKTVENAPQGVVSLWEETASKLKEKGSGSGNAASARPN